MVFSPTYATPPLSADFPSAIDPYLSVLEKVWKKAYGYWADGWQVELLRRAFEVYPAGHRKAGVLRFRQVIISLARQNGKTELAALASVFWLLWREKNEYMTGIAANASQARLIYDRVRKVIDANKSLSSRMNKLTDTRGIQTKKGTTYIILANKENSAQGYSVGLGLLDELHTYRNESVYSAILSGGGSRDNALVFGITTAGDDESELLKGLYEQGQESLEDPNTRFGFFCWEASEAEVPEDDEELLRLLTEANPALQDGRIDHENIISDVRSMPTHDIIRYRFNRFVSSTNSFIEIQKWNDCQRKLGERIPELPARLVFGIDRTPDMGFASIVAATLDENGVTHTDLVASLRKPTLEKLLEVAISLQKYRPASFVVDGYLLRDLAEEMKRRGIPVEIATHGERIAASSLLSRKILEKKLTHGGQPLFSVQLAHTKVKYVGEAAKIARTDSGVEIDSIIALSLAVALAEQVAAHSGKVQVF